MVQETHEPDVTVSLDDARDKMESWRKDYNEVLPYSAIGNKPPISLVFG